MPLIAQTHCSVLSIVLCSQTVIYVVSKSTNHDKNYWGEHIKSWAPHLKIQINVYFQNKMKTMETARFGNLEMSCKSCSLLETILNLTDRSNFLIWSCMLQINRIYLQVLFDWVVLVERHIKKYMNWKVINITGLILWIWEHD